MMHRWASVVMAAFLVAASCSPRGSSGRPRVVTAFYPLTYLVQRIAGGAVEISDLTPAGVEPHDLELTSSQVRDLFEADLVVYEGEGFQPALEQVVSDLEDAETLDVFPIALPSHGRAELDPHVWLDPQRMIDIAGSVAAELERLDPDRSDDFRNRLAALTEDLETLDTDLESGLGSCARREIVTSHEAFGYLADRYGLEQIAIAGLDPESEPSPARLVQVAEEARAAGVTTIFFEQLAPREIADTLADELGVEAAVLDPLESRPAHGDYETVMRSNLRTLQEALDCD